MEVIDLTQLMTNGMTVFPGSKPVLLNRLSTIESGGYNETGMHISTHTGTHVDCGRHLIKSGFATDSTEAGRFCGKGLVIDCRSENLITADFLFRFESRIRATDFVILYTGWSKHWGSSEYYTRFPVPDERAAAYLAGFPLKGAGIDGPSFDPLESVHLPVHIALLSAEIVLIENLTNIESLPAEGFLFCCFPLKVENGDGSPVRAVGIVNSD